MGDAKCNFAGKGALPVGSVALTRAGTTNMAGNVKEWCWNSSAEKRYILGGAWNEPVYMFTDADAQLPFERGPTYGFRCIKADRLCCGAFCLVFSLSKHRTSRGAMRPCSC